MAKKEQTKFKSKAEQELFESFCKNHIKNILDCARFNHVLLRGFIKKNLTWPHAMEVETDNKYFEFTIFYDEGYAIEHFVKTKNTEEILRTLCHEIAHFPTGEIQDHVEIDNSSKKQSYVFERCTQLVSLWLYDLYTLHYMPLHKIDIKTGLKK